MYALYQNMIYLESKKQAYISYTPVGFPPHPPSCSLVPSPMLVLDLHIAGILRVMQGYMALA